MTINSITNPANLASAAAAAAPQTNAAAVTAATGGIANQNVFLQLLVAQLKNQDPSSPADPTQFITQLAQFSELSNTTQMSSDLTTIRQQLAAAEAALVPTAPVIS
jgi:flagellar basal-body rod modification protein FlgD